MRRLSPRDRAIHDLTVKLGRAEAALDEALTQNARLEKKLTALEGGDWPLRQAAEARAADGPDPVVFMQMGELRGVVDRFGLYVRDLGHQIDRFEGAVTAFLDQPKIRFVSPPQTTVSATLRRTKGRRR